MRTIIAGSRNITIWPVDLDPILKQSGFDITEVVSGGARGIDRSGGRWAAQNAIPVKWFPADWTIHGKAAGMIRNELMADYAEALIAIWDGESRGTKHMIKTAEEKGLQVFVHVVDGGSDGF